jgi:hypothetical protein
MVMGECEDLGVPLPNADLERRMNIKREIQRLKGHILLYRIGKGRLLWYVHAGWAGDGAPAASL